ncbi:MAG: flagellar basal body rod protein FlgF [Gammaproteobacteria bacterium]
MSTMIQLAMSGARETMMAQAVNSHNLANAGTPGFRADLIKFSEAYQTEAGRPRMLNAIDTSDGGQRVTGRVLDVAINGDGWMAVESADGSEAYTRRGDLRVDSVGQLTNGAGQKIMGNGGAVSLPPYSQLSIGSDGTISIVPLGQGPEATAVVDKIRLVKLANDELYKDEAGELRLPETEVAEPDSELSLVSGALESSNVNPIEAMVKMIDLARRFESQIKMMQTSDENQQAMTNVMKIS